MFPLFINDSFRNGLLCSVLIVYQCIFIVVYCLFVPGVAAPYWVSYDFATGTGHFGLWRVRTQKLNEILKHKKILITGL